MEKKKKKKKKHHKYVNSYDGNATCNAWKHNARRGENDQERQWPPFDPRYRRYINTGKMYSRGANEMFRVCTFVNASWHGCAPTIMYCLASGSGYREPVSAQVFAVLCNVTLPSFFLSFLLFSFSLSHFLLSYFVLFIFFSSSFCFVTRHVYSPSF